MASPRCARDSRSETSLRLSSRCRVRRSSHISVLPAWVCARRCTTFGAPRRPCIAAHTDAPCHRVCGPRDVRAARLCPTKSSVSQSTPLRPCRSRTLPCGRVHSALDSPPFRPPRRLLRRSLRSSCALASAPDCFLPCSGRHPKARPGCHASRRPCVENAYGVNRVQARTRIRQPLGVCRALGRAQLALFRFLPLAHSRHRALGLKLGARRRSRVTAPVLAHCPPTAAPQAPREPHVLRSAPAQANTRSGRASSHLVPLTQSGRHRTAVHRVHPATVRRQRTEQISVAETADPRANSCMRPLACCRGAVCDAVLRGNALLQGPGDDAGPRAAPLLVLAELGTWPAGGAPTVVAKRRSRDHRVRGHRSRNGADMQRGAARDRECNATGWKPGPRVKQPATSFCCALREGVSGVLRAWACRSENGRGRKIKATTLGLMALFQRKGRKDAARDLAFMCRRLGRTREVRGRGDSRPQGNDGSEAVHDCRGTG
ncbi:hypothetical protein ERJ75_000099500 [Trypanosoma vivax]|nr:hypothetical protein ERJ75_000099500 [Trypanosoma vivax]